MPAEGSTSTLPRASPVASAGVVKKRGRPKKNEAGKELARKVSAASNGASDKTVRAKRTQAACVRCKTKKTKCDFGTMSASGEQINCCTRCANDGAICTMGVRKDIEFKQFPPAYTEMVEHNQYSLAEVVLRLYSEAREESRWRYKEPRLDENGKPILHDIVTAIVQMSQHSLQMCAQLGIDPVKSFPKDAHECKELAADVEASMASTTNRQNRAPSHASEAFSPASLSSTSTSIADDLHTKIPRTPETTTFAANSMSSPAASFVTSSMSPPATISQATLASVPASYAAGQTMPAAASSSSSPTATRSHQMSSMQVPMPLQVSTTPLFSQQALQPTALQPAPQMALMAQQYMVPVKADVMMTVNPTQLALETTLNNFDALSVASMQPMGWSAEDIASFYFDGGL